MLTSKLHVIVLLGVAKTPRLGQITIEFADLVWFGLRFGFTGGFKYLQFFLSLQLGTIL